MKLLKFVVYYVVFAFFAILGGLDLLAQAPESLSKGIPTAFNGNVLCISAPEGSGGRLYAGAEDGLYVLDPSDRQWQKMDQGANIRNIRRIAYLNEGMYLATSDGLYLGKGSGWQLEHGKNDIKGVLVYSENKGGEVLLSWTADSIYLISKEGWRLVGDPTTLGVIDDVACRGKMIFVASGADIYTYSGPGTEWKKVSLYPGRIREDDPQEVSNDTSSEDAEGSLDEYETQAASRIYSGSEDGLTVATTNGVYRIDPEGNVKERIDTTSLVPGSVRDVVDAQEGLFASTDEAVFLYSPRDRTWRTFFEKAGDGNIGSMYECSDGEGRSYLWVAAGKSVYKLDLGCDSFIEGKMVEDPGFDRSFLNEPSICEVHKMAIKYAEVDPKKIQDWRNAARWKAVMPKISAGAGESNGDNGEIYTGATTSYYFKGPQKVSKDWDANVSWDLSDLVWNDAQTSIDVRSKLMVQLRNEILQEVTRLYFERKRLLTENGDDVDNYPAPSGKGHAKRKEPRTWSAEAKQIRIEELTAHIDALTGGKFSEAISRAEMSEEKSR